jgi:hypothetical protein
MTTKIRMNNNSPLERRTSRPQTLAAAFGGLLRAFGARASDSDLAARWDEIMGAEITAKARLHGLSKAKTGRTMTIRATSPAFALELSYLAEDIRRRANKYFGYEAIGKILVKK